MPRTKGSKTQSIKVRRRLEYEKSMNQLKKELDVRLQERDSISSRIADLKALQKDYNRQIKAIERKMELRTTRYEEFKDSLKESEGTARIGNAVDALRKQGLSDEEILVKLSPS